MGATVVSAPEVQIKELKCEQCHSFFTDVAQIRPGQLNWTVSNFGPLREWTREHRPHGITELSVAEYRLSRQY